MQRFDKISLTSRLKKNRLYLDTFAIALSSDQSIRANGWIAVDGKYDLQLNSDKISLKHIKALQNNSELAGNLLISASGKGDLKNPRATGQIKISDIRLDQKPVKEITAQIDISDQLARLNIQRDFLVKGNYHLKKRNFSADIQFDKTRLSPYFTQFANRKELDGKISGTITAEGNVENLKNMKADFDITHLAIFTKDCELIRTEGFSAKLSGGKIFVDKGDFRLLEDGFVTLSGNVDVNGSLDMKIDGDIPVKCASILHENIALADGRILLTANFTGNTDDPKINGHIDIKNIRGPVPYLEDSLKNLNGKIQISSQSIKIDSLSGNAGEGEFSLTGEMELKDFFPESVDFNFTARRIVFYVPDTLNLMANVSLQWKGTRKDSLLSGEAVIVEGVYYKPVDLNLMLLESAIGKKRESVPKKTDVEIPFIKNMRMDIQIKRRNPFRVDNNLAEMNLSPDLRIHGTINSLVVSGRASVDSGTVTYQKNVFQIEKGVINFNNPYRIEPEVDIKAVTEIRKKWEITLNVSGPPDSLNFQLQSVPRESHADILSLLVLRKTTSEIRSGSGDKLTTKQILASLVADTFGDDIKKETGLDILEVETDSQNTETQNGIKVTIGKELTQRMKVKYAMETGDGKMVQKAIAEYQLLENVLISGFQEIGGKFGGELQYRLEFR